VGLLERNVDALSTRQKHDIDSKDKIIFVITHQDFRGSSFYCKSNIFHDRFTASNGLQLISCSHPDFDIEYNTLYTMGSNKGMDNCIMTISISYIYKIVSAIDEYNEHIKYRVGL
jgi:hypothetical protein